jgi:hypothetical protein
MERSIAMEHTHFPNVFFESLQRYLALMSFIAELLFFKGEHTNITLYGVRKYIL